MAFIIEEEVDKTFYRNFIEYSDDITKESFQNFWFAQKISYACSEDDYSRFLDFYGGKCIFDDFTTKYGASRDVGKFLEYCSHHRQEVMKRLNFSSDYQFNEPETEIYQYWMFDYVQHWVDNMNALSIASLKHATVYLTMRMYELEVPCAKRRTCEDIVKFIPRVLHTLPKDQQTKWCLMCTADLEEMFVRNTWKPCVCIDCDKQSLDREKKDSTIM